MTSAIRSCQCGPLYDAYKQEAILDEYERSGMSGPEFAEYFGIKYQTFATWVQNRRKRKAGGLVVAKGAVSWLEAEVGGEDSPAGTPGLVVELSGGARMSPSFSTGGKNRLFSGFGSPRGRINTRGRVGKVVVVKTHPLHKAVFVTMIGSRYVFTKHAAVERRQ